MQTFLFFSFSIIFCSFSFLPCLLSCLSLVLALLPTLILWLFLPFILSGRLLFILPLPWPYLCLYVCLAFPPALLFVLYLTLPCIWHFLQPTLLPPFFSSYRTEDCHGNYHFQWNLIRIFLEKECLKSFLIWFFLKHFYWRIKRTHGVLGGQNCLV